MLIKLVFCLTIISFAKFTVHSPEELRELDIPYSYANFGKPALIPIYGKIQFEYLSECTFNGLIGTNSILLIEYNTNCYAADVIYSLYKAGAAFIIILDPNTELKYNITSLFYSKQLYEDFTALLIPSKIYYDNFSSYQNVWISYKYDYAKSSIPNVELVLSGNRNQEVFIIKDIMKLLENHTLSYNNFTVKIAYTYSDSFDAKDCFTSNSYSYCANPTPTGSGSDLFKSLLASLTFYNSLPQNDQSIQLFLEYLLDLYYTCDIDYSIGCNYFIIKKHSGEAKSDESLLSKAVFLENPDSHLIINGEYFPWSRWIELGYCLSFNDIPVNCPICNGECFIDVQELESCIVDCNNKFCVYSDFQCFAAEGIECYYFGINCAKCGNAEVCLDYDDDGKSSENVNTVILLSVLIPVLFCLGLIIIIITTYLIMKRKKNKGNFYQYEKLKPVRYDKSIEIYGKKICTIDLVKIHKGDMIVVTPCKHIFHPGCLKEWLGNFIHNPDKMCPVCKASLANYEV